LSSAGTFDFQPSGSVAAPSATVDELAQIFTESGLDASGLRIVDRRTSDAGGTFPSEIVTCRLGDGSRLRLFCKRAAATVRDDHGHRGGVPYEADVYRTLLRPLDLPLPTFYGSNRSDAGALLVLGFLEGSCRINKSREPQAMTAAAAWIGRFAAATAAGVDRPDLTFLTRYDADFYRGWVERTAAFSAGVATGWAELAAMRGDELAAILVSAPQTAVHGEYYPENVLVVDGEVHPVDWESAAVAPSEIDLAALTELWPARDVALCEAAYADARWGGVAPDGHADVLEAARLYLQFRWLGENPRWTRDPHAAWRFDVARTAAKRLGLIR
jgi:hypothetical protein